MSKYIPAGSDLALYLQEPNLLEPNKKPVGAVEFIPRDDYVFAWNATQFKEKESLVTPDLQGSVELIQGRGIIGSGILNDEWAEFTGVTSMPTYPFTLVAQCNLEDLSVTNYILSIGACNTTKFAGYVLRITPTSVGLHLADNTGLNANNRLLVEFTSSSNIETNKDLTLVVKATSSSNFKAWVNGVNLGTPSYDGTLTASPVSGGLPLSIAGGWYLSNKDAWREYGFSGSVSLAATIDSGLSDGECYALSKNPWKLTKPAANDLVFLGSAAAGGGTVTGDIAASTETITGALSGTFISTGDIAASTETITGELSGITTAPTTGDISGTVDDVTGALSGSFISTGNISVTIDDSISALFGSVTSPVTGNISATLDAVTGLLSGNTTTPTTGDIAATTENVIGALSGNTATPTTGDIAASTETITGDIVGHVAHTGNIVALVDTITSNITGVVSGPATGAIAATVETISGEFTGTHYQLVIGDIAVTIDDVVSALVGANGTPVTTTPARRIASNQQSYTSRGIQRYSRR